MEANRQFFHPIGLEMYVICDNDGNLKRFGGFRVRQDGEPPFGMGPIPPEVFHIWKRKEESVKSMMEAARKEREEIFGSFIEPLTVMDIPNNDERSD
jgi:hypothetical protein